MRDVNVTRFGVNAVAALRSCILEIVEKKTRKPVSPPNVEEVFDTVWGFLSEQVPVETDDEELALLSYVEAVIEAETGRLFNKRYFELQREEHATKVRSSMHKGVEWVSPDTPVRVLANIMREQDIGAIPIGEDDRLIGMITDRDVTVRAVANGTDVSALTAKDIMTNGIVWCRDGDDVNLNKSVGCRGNRQEQAHGWHFEPRRSVTCGKYKSGTRRRKGGASPAQSAAQCPCLRQLRGQPC